jgi:hypothetical protein
MRTLLLIIVLATAGCGIKGDPLPVTRDAAATLR